MSVFHLLLYLLNHNLHPFLKRKKTWTFSMEKEYFSRSYLILMFTLRRMVLAECGVVMTGRTREGGGDKCGIPYE